MGRGAGEEGTGLGTGGRGGEQTIGGNRRAGRGAHGEAKIPALGLRAPAAWGWCCGLGNRA